MTSLSSLSPRERSDLLRRCDRYVVAMALATAAEEEKAAVLSASSPRGAAWYRAAWASGSFWSRGQRLYHKARPGAFIVKSEELAAWARGCLEAELELLRQGLNAKGC